jgi:hypothetical protein
VSYPVFTSEELRVVAMNTSTRRGKSVARRRLIWRWFAWFMWCIFLPLAGLVTVFTGAAAFAAYAYLGHDVAYNSAQTWVQEHLGPFKHATTIQISTLPNRSDSTSMIPLTDEATPDLYLDRNLTIKAKP